MFGKWPIFTTQILEGSLVYEALLAKSSVCSLNLKTFKLSKTHKSYFKSCWNRVLIERFSVEGDPPAGPLRWLPESVTGRNLQLNEGRAADQKPFSRPTPTARLLKRAWLNQTVLAVAGLPLLGSNLKPPERRFSNMLETLREPLEV